MHQMHISTTQVSSVMLRSKKLEIKEKNVQLKEPSDENQTECHGIKPNPSKNRAMPEGGNPSFWDEFTKFYFFLDSSIHIRIFKQVPKYLATGL
jgi:hypothetical protein